jgi:phospholipase/carboxylesterase
MNDNNQPTLTNIDGWVFRIKAPSPPTSETKILLLLHGHLGNENVMWILANPLPKGYTLIAPRAPVKLGENQFSWHKIQPQWPTLDQYKRLTDQLLTRVDAWAKDNLAGSSPYDVMGFSQGAVMAYALAFLHPDRVKRIAAIAGLIPQNWRPQLDAESLNRTRFFIAHGTQDEIIPVKKARQASEWLKEKGADVSFCTAETGHKLSANCFKGLGEFFSV